MKIGGTSHNMKVDDRIIGDGLQGGAKKLAAFKARISSMLKKPKEQLAEELNEPLCESRRPWSET